LNESTTTFSGRLCNTQRCRGDEECIAFQDLIIAIDGSGSLGTTFSKLKRMAVLMLKRYRGRR
jgi:hypothetical protein